jgi:membrane peptidoglycan carboxypeptidase
MDDGIAFLITNVLRKRSSAGRGRRCATSGFEATAAGKTGTTNDATDTWFVGYTPRLVAAVWMGFDEPRPIMGRPRADAGRARLGPHDVARARVPHHHARPGPRPTVLQAWIDPPSGGPSPTAAVRTTGRRSASCSCARACPGDLSRPGRGHARRRRVRRSPDEDEARGRRALARRHGLALAPRAAAGVRGGRRPGAAPASRRAEDAERAWREARKEYERQSRNGGRKRSGGGAREREE